MVEKSSEKAWGQLKELLDSWKGKKGSLIPVLQQTQEIFGYLPQDVLLHISEELDIAISQIYGVVTFYAQFHLEPRGENIVRSCQGTACHVRGASNVLDAIKKKLGLKEGQATTDDLRFTLETVACIGACGLAPVLTVNDKVYPAMTPDKASALLSALKEGLIR